MIKSCLKNSKDPSNLIKTVKYKIDDYRNNPYFMRTFGTCIFCGPQGSGKTLSAVQYVRSLCVKYPRAILVTNVAIKDRPFNAYLNFDKKSGFSLRYLSNDKIITTEYILEEAEYDDFTPITVEYTGLDMLKYISNKEYGVIFFIDELHLELNSLESKNIDIEIMVEISQQRKQRKHIVGTSQIFMRLAKPLREQIFDIILCKEFFNAIQFNKWIDGTTAVEKDGKLEAEVKGRFLWFHSPEMYEQYDTYAKMKRYNKEWNGRKRIENFYNINTEVTNNIGTK